MNYKKRILSEGKEGQAPIHICEATSPVYFVCLSVRYNSLSLLKMLSTKLVWGVRYTCSPAIEDRKLVWSTTIYLYPSKTD